MAAETLGAIALLDPAIKFGRWLYKIAKLQAAFGDDFMTYYRYCYDEQVVLGNLLETEIGALSDEYREELIDVLQDINVLQQKPLEYKTAHMVHGKLASLSKLFEECAGLIDKYLKVSDDQSASEQQISSSDSVTTPNESEARDSQDSSSLPGSPGDLPSEISQKFLIRRVLHMKAKSHKVRDHVLPVLGQLQRHDVLRKVELQSSQASSMQQESKAGERVWDWVRHDRQRFIHAVHEIQEINYSLGNLVQIRSHLTVPSPPASGAENIFKASTFEAAREYLLALKGFFRNPHTLICPMT
ncbi:hypothetical protein MMC18_000546 [Xylographa bjoerkii]|nr:hypothetical protein [Xylographa bjoerkii]